MNAIPTILILGALAGGLLILSRKQEPGWAVGDGARQRWGTVLQPVATTVAAMRPGARRPYLPDPDRPPLPGRFRFSSVEEYAADGYRGLQIHLMQAARRWHH